MSKKISMAARPHAKPNMDKWVEHRESATVSTPPKKPKRLTIDIDSDLHTQLKIHCATQQVQIADLLRRLIEQEIT